MKPILLAVNQGGETTISSTENFPACGTQLTEAALAEGLCPACRTGYLLYLEHGFGVPLLVNGLAAHSLGTEGVIVRRRLGSRRHSPGKFTTAAALGNTTQGWSVHLEKTETAFLGRLQVAALRTQAEARWLAAELRRALGVTTQKEA